MNISNTAIELIKTFEGLSLKAYKCAAGVLTIGWGHTSGVKAGQTIDIDTAEQYLREDLKRFELYLNNNYKNLTQKQFDALISFCFNLGSIKHGSGLDEAIKSGDEIAIINKIMLYANAGGKKLLGLQRRRL